MPETSPSPYSRFKLFAAFLTVGIISLVQPGCNCSSSNGGTTTPSAITAVSPLSDSATALVSTDVTAVFRDEMDGASVESAFTLTVNNNPVPASVSYDAATKIAILIPVADLVPDTEYRATIASSVKDINGNLPLTTDFIWSFKTSPTIQLTSKNVSNVTSNDVSQNSDIDSTGRYIVFESEATNLTTVATTFNRSHIYRKDTVTGEVVLVSSDASGLVEADNDSTNPGISSNGRHVVFQSAATNLDTSIASNGITQIYLKDLDDNSIELVSRSATLSPDNSLAGASNASVSDDGLRIIFQSADSDLSLIDGGGIMQIYLKDLNDESVAMISRSGTSTAGNNTSGNPDMSTDGKHIVFESSASNLTTSNGFKHIYYVDTSATTYTIEQISMSTAGVEATANCNQPSVSNDGSMVVYDTNAILDGLDTNGTTDVYFHYRPFLLTGLISESPNTNNSGNGASTSASISGDANYVAFESLASDLVTGGALGIKDIYVRDLSVLPVIKIDRVNNPVSGAEATSDSDKPAISRDGRYVSFHSIAPFTTDDDDTLKDVFRTYNSTYP